MHHHTHTAEAPGTTGRTLHRAFFYDLLVQGVLLGQEKKLRASTVHLAALRRGDRVLEVGCGTGSLALAARRKAGAGVDVYGTDASPEMIERARQKARKAKIDIDFRVGLVERIDFPDATFDVVLSSFMVHHLPEPLQPAAFAEIYRVLKPGGRLLVVDFEPPEKGVHKALLSPFLGSMMTIDNSRLPLLMQQAGFRVVRTGRTDHPLASFALGEKAR